MLPRADIIIGRDPLTLENGITEELFLSRFPYRFHVRALNVFQAAREGLSADRTWWRYTQVFAFISDKWGRIMIPDGFITDFSSVPPILRSFYDDDSPTMLYPSGPHDLVFLPRADGTRGWLPDGRRLTLRQANELFTEAMYYCGASDRDRRHVFEGLMLGNLGIADEFALKEAA